MSVELSSSVLASDVAGYIESQDKGCLTEFIKHRFHDRFFEPFEGNPATHGFSMMAVSCLMIEALLCMQNGWNKSSEAKRSNGEQKSGSELFEEFFASSSELCEFRSLGETFYTNIRCGILHQAETTGGWRIRRKGPLVCTSTKIINATMFMDALKTELDVYLNSLKAKDFTDPLWVKFLKKIDFIVKNCT